MAYRSHCNVPIVNKFSNPNAWHWNRRTGDSDHNNARIIRENMVKFLKSTTHVSHLEEV